MNDNLKFNIKPFMTKIHLKSEILKDKFTEYVCQKYDIQNHTETETILPEVELSVLDNNEWNIAVIVGNSGSGKTNLIKSIGELIIPSYDEEKSAISQFDFISEQEVCDLFNGVGFSSVPSWLRKPHELSNGEKARLDLVYSIVYTPKDNPILIDEYSSVLNRTASMSMSYCLQRYIRKINRRIVIASCHFDIIQWLNPDFIFNLNKQNNGFVEAEKMNYLGEGEYEEVKRIDENTILIGGVGL